MPNHEFHYERIDRPEQDAVVFRMTGVLGESQRAHEFRDEFLAGLDTYPDRIVFSLSGLENMYSSGIGILANCFTEARDRGRTLCACGVPPVIHRTLTITGIVPLLREYESEDEAAAAE